jgi:hypothetical protein
MPTFAERLASAKLLQQQKQMEHSTFPLRPKGWSDAVLFAAKDMLLPSGAFAEHAETYNDLAPKLWQQFYSGQTLPNTPQGYWNPEGSHAASYMGGMDYGRRRPENLEELERLAKLYQFVDTLPSLSSGDWRHDRENAEANIAGLRDSRTVNLDPDTPEGQAELVARAVAWRKAQRARKE